MSFRYSAYGLTIELPFPCGPLPDADPTRASDVIVVEGEVPLNFSSPQSVAPNCELQDGKILYRRGPCVGRFLIENPSQVVFRRGKKADQISINHAFLNCIMPALLQLRGELVLHANTAAYNNGAAVISGKTGMGKSTTLAALMRSGCLMATDDLTVIQLDPKGNVVVVPGMPQMHLELKAAERLKFEVDGFERMGANRIRAVVPIKNEIIDTPIPLRAIFILETKTEGETEIQEISGLEKLQAFMGCQFGPVLPSSHFERFTVFSALIKQTPIFLIKRPYGQWTVDTVVRLIKETFQ
ncbi:MAG: hypothetical protein HQM08_24520 [Candidatus Riflebacteria bacterium]|nr:hypothetical protein [Candidatus Riflebacteria bacterium]